MSPEKKKNKNRILYDFDPILWGLLKKEAKGKKRTAPRQLEEVLAERYRPHALTDEERAEALRLAATREHKQRKEQIEPAAKKSAKKQANGPDKD